MSTKIETEENELAVCLVSERLKVQGTELSVCQDIAKRQQLGIAKYGTTVRENKLSLLQWMQHAYEETLDQAIYLKRSIGVLGAELVQVNECHSTLIGVKQYTYRSLLTHLGEWYERNGFDKHATIEGQFRKYIEELNELFCAMKECDVNAIKDAFGDLQIVCIMACLISSRSFQGLTFGDGDGSVEGLLSEASYHLISSPLDALHYTRFACSSAGYDPDECISLAWHEIKDRRGYWSNGSFVKLSGKEGV